MDTVPHDEPMPGKRKALVACVLISDLCFTGLIFGWAPLLLILQDEQQYGELCDEDDDTYPCVQQENQLNLMFAAASVAANIGALPIGMFLDYCGPKVAITVAGIVEVSGLLLMAVADSQTFDVFVLAYVMLAFGGCITMMSSFPVSFLVLQYQTAILAAISCLFDGSSVIFLLLYTIRSMFDVQRSELFFGLAVFACVLYIILIALWHVNESDLYENTSNDEKDSSPLLPILDRIESAEYNTMQLSKMANHTTAPAVSIVDQPLPYQIFTFQFGFILVFAVIHVLRATLYIGTTNKLLDNYGDAEQDYFFTKVFSFVLPMGFVFVPSIDFVVEQKGLGASLLVTNCLGAIYNAMELIPSLALQCLTFFIFTGYRAFLYAVMSAFAAKTFGLKNLGTLAGLIFSMSSIASLLEYPAVFISNAYFDGDLSFVNSLSLMMCVLLFPYTECYRNQEHARRHSIDFGSAAEVDDSPVAPGMAYLRSPYRKSPVRHPPTTSATATKF